MNDTQLILLSIGSFAFFVFGIRYVKKLQEEDEFRKVKLTVAIERTENGFSVYCKEIDGIIAVGDSIDAVKDDFEESFMIWLNYTEGQYKDMWRSDFEFTYVEE